MNLDEALTAYREKFDESFPIMMVKGMEESELISVILDCLKNETPYEPEDDPEADY